MVIAAMKLTDTYSSEENLWPISIAYWKAATLLQSTKVHLLKAMVFSSSHMWMWELDCEESWAPKNWCFRTVVLEKTLESPLDSKEIQPIHSKGDQSRIFIGRTDAEAETRILATWCKELTYLKRPQCWERLKVGREGGNREWVGWMASLTQWT